MVTFDSMCYFLYIFAAQKSIKFVVMKLESNNQLVIVTKADYDASIREQAHKEALSLMKPQSPDISCKGEIIKPIICNGERFLQRKDVANLLNVKNSTLWRWNNKGTLKNIKVGGRKVLYRYDDILAMLKGELNYDK